MEQALLLKTKVGPFPGAWREDFGTNACTDMFV